MSELVAKLERNARFYAAEAKAMKPVGARHLGPTEAATIARLLTEAAEAVKMGEESDEA